MTGPPDPHAEAILVELQSFSTRLDQAVTSVARMRQAECQVFFSGLSAAVDIARAAQTELDRRAATRFSIFDYFNERETDLSRVFGGLLDPTGNHGQGSRFLGLFLNEACRGMHPARRASDFPSRTRRGAGSILSTQRTTVEGSILFSSCPQTAGSRSRTSLGLESRRSRSQTTCGTSAKG